MPAISHSEDQVSAVEEDVVSLWASIQQPVEVGDPTIGELLKRYQVEHGFSNAVMGEMIYEIFIHAIEAQSRSERVHGVDFISIPAVAARYYKNPQLLRELELRLESGVVGMDQGLLLSAYIFQSSARLDSFVEHALNESAGDGGRTYSIYADVLDCLRRQPEAATKDKIDKLKEWANPEDDASSLSILDAYIVTMDADYRASTERMNNLERIFTRFEKAGLPLRSYYRIELEKLRSRQRSPDLATNTLMRIELPTPVVNESGATNIMTVTIPGAVLPPDRESRPAKLESP